MTSATINIEDINANLKVVHIAGQLDESNVDEKIKEIYGVVEKNSDNLSLIFDLENLEYMNSKSIGYLTDLYGKLSESGGKVVIAAAKPNIVDILQVVGLTQLIQSYNSVKEAASALGADSPAAPAPAAAPETPAATETAAPAVETPAAEAPQEPQAPQTPAQNENPDQQNNETFKIQ